MPSDSKDALVLRAPELLKTMPTARGTEALQGGDCISWTRNDGTAQTGFIDYLHCDAAADSWAFVSLGADWAAVNVRVAVNVRKIGPSSKAK